MRKKFFSRFVKLINLYPPFIGAGVWLKEVDKDRTRFVVTTRLTFRNKNLFGTQFGGTLYSMTDPFYAFILVLNLGTDYIVWDKSASIKFVKPGKTKVKAIIEISKEEIHKIKEFVDQNGKGNFNFSTEIKDKEGNVVAVVNKELYVRNKKIKRD